MARYKQHEMFNMIMMHKATTGEITAHYGKDINSTKRHMARYKQHEMFNMIMMHKATTGEFMNVYSPSALRVTSANSASTAPTVAAVRTILPWSSRAFGLSLPAMSVYRTRWRWEEQQGG